MKTHDLLIERVAAGGSGVARIGDRAILVPGALAGERVRVEIEDARRNARDRRPAGVRVLTVLDASPDRVDPPCERVGTCGGCDFMHVAPARQLDLLASMVREQLAHATRADVPSPTLTHAPRPLGYRSRARLGFEARRGRVDLGWRARRSHDLVPTRACLVLDERLAPALDEARAILEGSTSKGELVIALGARGAPAIELRPDADLAPTAFGRIEAAVRSGRIAGARVWPAGSSVPVSFGDPRVEQIAADGASMRSPPASFAQPSDEGAALLATRVRAAVDALLPESARSKARAVELFSGSGTLTIPLAAMGFASLTAVELDRAACDEARQNLASRGLSVTLVNADADTYALDRSDLVVLDPPRTGARGATTKIIAAKVRRVVYVSCDPPTLARDVEQLAGAGWTVRAVEVVELFPQTTHVETIVSLERLRPS